VYLTVVPYIHIAGNGENLILGTDAGSNVTIGVNGNVTIQANAFDVQNWTFDNTGNLTLSCNMATTGKYYCGNIITGTGTTGNITGANVIAANRYPVQLLHIQRCSCSYRWAKGIYK